MPGAARRVRHRPSGLTIVVVFVGLFLISVGLDEVANPRLRRSV